MEVVWFPLLATFVHYANETLPYNIVIVASAEEKTAVKQLNSVLKHLPELLCDCRQPTLIQLAAERKGC
jgi:acetylornithine deacetylase